MATYLGSGTFQGLIMSPMSTGRFRVRISGAHAEINFLGSKERSTVSSIICDRWLILS